MNMAWSNGTMGDAEYLSAFHHLVLPIAYEVAMGDAYISSEQSYNGVVIEQETKPDDETYRINITIYVQTCSQSASSPRLVAVNPCGG